MAKDDGTHFDIPADMCALAEKSVEQAKQAFDIFISAAQHRGKPGGKRESRRQGSRGARNGLRRAEYRVLG